MDRFVEIDGTRIGANYSPYVVAELSANHNGSIERARKTIEAAYTSGANAIKLQTYTPDTLTIDCQNDDFIIKGGLWNGYSLYDLYKQAYTPFEWHKDLFEYARSLGITCFSTPFDESAVDLLEDLNAPAYKIASFEAIDLPLIKYVAQTDKPMIISTGMANLQEIEEAVATANSFGPRQIILLHCISAYPAPINQCNLATIEDLERRFGVVVGLSDHTLGTLVSAVSVAVGASFIEKHFTLDRNDKGPDSEFSIEPNELKELCHNSRNAWLSLGKAGYEQKQAEANSIQFRRSLYWVEAGKTGDTITPSMVRRIRPGFGIPPKHYDDVVGSKLAKDVYKGKAVEFEDFLRD